MLNTETTRRTVAILEALSRREPWQTKAELRELLVPAAMNAQQLGAHLHSMERSGTLMRFESGGEWHYCLAGVTRHVIYLLTHYGSLRWADEPRTRPMIHDL